MGRAPAWMESRMSPSESPQLTWAAMRRKNSVLGWRFVKMTAGTSAGRANSLRRRAERVSDPVKMRLVTK